MFKLFHLVVGEDLYRHSLLSNPIDLSIKYLKWKSPRVFTTPVFKYFGTKNRYYFENWQYLKFSKFIKLRSISLVQSSVLSWFWHYCLGPSGSVFTLNFLPYKPTRLPPYFEDCRLFVLNQTLLFRFLIFQIFWLYLHWWDINCWKKKIVEMTICRI